MIALRAWRFYRSAYEDNGLRRAGRRRLAVDLRLFVWNLLCQRAERRHLAAASGHEPAPVFIVGPPRSGTTLLFQLFAHYGPVGFVSNYVARYWLAPVVGSRRYVARFPDRPAPEPLESDLGRTCGPHGPHEFSWFWHYWMGPAVSDDRTAAELDQADWPRIRAEIAALERERGVPYVFKSINFVDYHIALFASIFPAARFVRITRDPAFVVQSILQSRQRRYGDRRVWWSVRPRAWREWSDLAPAEQAARQVRDIEGALDRAFAALPAACTARVPYETLTGAPDATLRGLFARLGLGGPVAGAELAALRLGSGNRNRSSEAEWLEIRQALEGAA